MARYVARERVLGLRRGVVCDGALRGRERVASGVCLTSWLGSYICSKMLSAAREEMREEGASAAAAQQPGGRERANQGQDKSRITLRDTWSRRLAGGMRPVRRAGWVCAESGAPAARSFMG